MDPDHTMNVMIITNHTPRHGGPSEPIVTWTLSPWLTMGRLLVNNQLPRGVPPGGPEIKTKPGLTSLKLVVVASLVSGHHRNFLFLKGLKRYFKSQLGTSIRIDRQSNR